MLPSSSLSTVSTPYERLFSFYLRSYSLSNLHNSWIMLCFIKFAIRITSCMYIYVYMYISLIPYDRSNITPLCMVMLYTINLAERLVGNRYYFCILLQSRLLMLFYFTITLDCYMNFNYFWFFMLFQISLFVCYAIHIYAVVFEICI